MAVLLLSVAPAPLPNAVALGLVAEAFGPIAIASVSVAPSLFSLLPVPVAEDFIDTYFVLNASATAYN